MCLRRHWSGSSWTFSNVKGFQVQSWCYKQWRCPQRCWQLLQPCLDISIQNFTKQWTPKRQANRVEQGQSKENEHCVHFQPGWWEATYCQNFTHPNRDLQQVRGNTVLIGMSCEAHGPWLSWKSLGWQLWMPRGDWIWFLVQKQAQPCLHLRPADHTAVEVLRLCGRPRLVLHIRPAVWLAM